MRFLVALIVNLFRLLFWPLRALVSFHAAPRRGWVEVKIDGPVVEVAPRQSFWDRRSRPTSLHRLRQLVDVCAEDPRVVGLVFVLAGWQGGNGTATALRRILVAARQRGKRVVAYLPRGGGTRTTYVASAADQVILAPQSHLSPLGYAVQAQYLKGALDRVGVEPEVLSHGRFKAAGETLISTEMSAAQREQLEALLDDQYEALVAALSEGRGVGRALAEQWVNQGPWSAPAAIRQGLADAGAHEDELPKKLASESDAKAKVIGYRRYLHRRVLKWRAWRRPRRIGVIELHGPIVFDPVPIMPVATGQQFVERVQRALDDRTVRGVIIHVNSPGGSVLVSDQMLHSVQRLAEKKPVVACFGDVAASGGYLAALGAAAIYAEPTTITGSIGVVAARLGILPLLEKVGITVQTVKRGQRADMNSPARPLAAEERELLEAELEEVYRYFVGAVASGRGRPASEIEPLAEGRIYSGVAAHRLGLVDGTGGFPEALRELQRRIGGRAHRLEPQIVGVRWTAELVASLAPSPAARSGSWGELAVLTWGGLLERTWVWCPSRLVETR